ncbi:TPR-like protein [Phellopilus nigrolimitatus]|nr:TPR-like protein [Phellopilus nigrolimitatus]
MSAQQHAALQKLASFRVQNSRQSQEIAEHGAALLKNKRAPGGRGADADAWLEQLALAAIDVGRLEVADECISRLTVKFPGSPRVNVLVGIRKEASFPAEAVLAYYDGLLEADEANAAAWKRKVVVLRRTGDVARAVDELSQFLDTYYTDVEGWLELADIYSSCNQYDSALRSLQHALLLAPQNPFYVLHAAELAYTAGDVPLAAKFFLGVVDMTEDPDLDSAARIEAVPEGIAVRAWFGLKQCTRCLIKDPRSASTSPSQTPAPQHLHLLDELATERLLTSYSTYSGGPRNGPVRGREELVKWLEAK